MARAHARQLAVHAYTLRNEVLPELAWVQLLDPCCWSQEANGACVNLRVLCMLQFIGLGRICIDTAEACCCCCWRLWGAQVVQLLWRLS